MRTRVLVKSHFRIAHFLRQIGRCGGLGEEKTQLLQQYCLAKIKISGTAPAIVEARKQAQLTKWLSLRGAGRPSDDPAVQLGGATSGGEPAGRSFWRGWRPEVACQLIREYVYLYGAVSPEDGTCIFLIPPAPDTECFQFFWRSWRRNITRN
jgi:hypothetical protein